MAETRSRRPARRRRAAIPSRRIPVAVAVALVAVVLAWVAITASRDRFWDDTRAAGHRAYQRGNFRYAQRMYREALQQAEDLDPGGPRVMKSLLDMSRVYAALGYADSASQFRTRSQALRQRLDN